MSFLQETAMSRRSAICLAATGAAALATSAPLSGAWAEEEKPAPREGLAFTAGTYTGQAEGRGGTITVEVAFSDDAIQSVEVTGHAETPFISDVALVQIPEDIVRYQSTGVDVVSGATLTSFGIKNAVEDAAKQAGADLKLLGQAPQIEKSDAVVDIECDIAIVGAGAAGMGAAIAAAEQGAKVVVLEKTSNMGGNAVVSGGMIEYIDAPQELRWEMTPEHEDYFNQLMSEAREGGASAEFLDKLQADHDAYYADGKTTVYDVTGLYALERCQVERDGDYSSITADTPVNDPESPLVKTAPWLESLGLEFATPLTTCFGYIWPNFIIPRKFVGGQGYFDLFRRLVDSEQYPVELLTCTPVTDLIMDGACVTGVTAIASDGTVYNVRAGKGVILATGGYSGNPDMLKEYNTLWSWDADTVIHSDNTAGHMGDGIKMALAAGGHVDGMGSPELFPTVDPVQYIIENVVCFGPFLNKEGDRFVDEMLGRFDIVEKTLEQTGQMLYIPCDARSLDVQEDGLTMGGLGPDESTLLEYGQLFRGDTLEEVAEAAGIDPEGFVATVVKWNEMVLSGNDPDCGRTIFADCATIEEPPFYISPATFAAHATQGGVVVDDKGRVVTEAGDPIEGLYCAGEIVFDRLGLRSIGEGMAVAQGMLA